MHSPRHTTFDAGTKLLIVCLKRDLSEVRSIVNGCASLDWESANEIRLLPVIDSIHEAEDGRTRHRRIERRASILQRIQELAPRGTAARVIIVGSLPFEDVKPVENSRNPSLAGSYCESRQFIPVRSCYQFKEVLPPMLQHCRLDWFAQITTAIEHYHQYREGQVDLWLQQFGSLGYEWIGKALLQVLDFWSSSKVGDALFEYQRRRGNPAGVDEWLNLHDFITYKDPSKGNSGAVVSRFLAKRWPGLSGKTKPWPEVLELLRAKPAATYRILYLEDCILTGQECISLLNNLPDGVLAKNALTFKFAVGTAYGIHRLEHYAGLKKWQKVSVIKPVSGFIPNLKPEALKIAEQGLLFDANARIQNQGNYVIPGISIRGGRALNSNQRKEIISFCRTVGRQLMFYYLQDKFGSPQQANEMAQEQSLGFGNLGLLTAFAHGVPDNVIPLLRCGGSVSVDGHSVEWVPLFPQATGI